MQIGDLQGAGQYLRSVFSQVIETETMAQQHIATLCSLFMGLIAVGREAGAPSMASCLSGNVVVHWKELLDESKGTKVPVNELDEMYAPATFPPECHDPRDVLKGRRAKSGFARAVAKAVTGG